MIKVGSANKPFPEAATRLAENLQLKSVGESVIHFQKDLLWV